jgi:hypothetical protein
MKKAILFIITILLLSLSTVAQIDKSTWLVGGNGNINFYTQDVAGDYITYKAKMTKIDIDCSVGYFIKDKLATGLRPTFFLENGKYFQNGTQQGQIGTRTQLYVGPFIRYYFLEKEKAFNILADISYQYGTNIDPISITDHKSKGIIKQFTASAGVEFFFNNTVGIEILAGYKSKYEDINDLLVGSNYTDNKKGFQINIGFQIHLQKN